MSVTNCIEKIIDNRKTGKILNQGKLFKPYTIRNYKTHLNKLKEFCTYKQQKTITSTDVIKKEFIYSIENYLTINLEKHLNTVAI